MNNLKVALIQHACTHDAEQNLQKSIDGIIEAAKKGAQLVVLQELHTSLYFCITQETANFELAESIPGKTTTTLSQIAKEHQIVIVASLFEKRATGLYHNTAVVIESNGEIAGKYRKMHIPDDPGYNEKFYFTPGDLGFKPIETSVGKLGVLVCWDQWYPEAARCMALAGADLLIYPTAIGWDPEDTSAEKQRQLDAWITIQRGHSVANGIPLISCNRIGVESHPNGSSNQFWGNSFVCGPQGELLAHADDHNESILMAEIDMERSEAIRRIWPFFRDRRIDAYDALNKRFAD